MQIIFHLLKKMRKIFPKSPIRKIMAETKDFPDHWLEPIVQEILNRNEKEVNLSTGKTPSGHIHMGILRELIICDSIKKTIEKRGKTVHFRLFFDSLDPLKRFPDYIDSKFAKENIGKPMAFTSNPFGGNAKNYAEYFGNELAEQLPRFGINVEIMWTDQLYKTEEMKKLTRIALLKNDIAKEIIKTQLTASMKDEDKIKYEDQLKDWTVAVIPCEKCQKTIKKQSDGSIIANRILDFIESEDKVTYHCPNCGYEGSAKISDNIVKLSWRIDWPAKWTLFHTSCEPAGKDHCTPGGSYDTGLALSKGVFNYPGPVKLAYEWLRLGDQDMKTSKGIVFTPKKYLEMADPEIIRMLILMTNPNKHISFRVEEIPQYYNEFERIERIYYGLDEATSPEEKKEILYAFPLIMIHPIPEKYQKRLSFKFLTYFAQLRSLMGDEGIYRKAVEYMRKEQFNPIITKEEFLRQISMASNWLDELKLMIQNEKDPGIIKKLNSKADFFSILENVAPDIIQKLTPEQKRGIELFVDRISPVDDITEEKVKEIMMGIQNEMGIKPMAFFQAFYLILLGTTKGPRISSLITMLDKTWFIDRMKSAIK
jgi:lysyl-tRNA synthetase class 1